MRAPVSAPQKITVTPLLPASILHKRVRLLLTLSALFAATGALGEGQGPRYVEKMTIPGAHEVVVVAEGEFEPRSVGSYSLRLYSGVPAEFPTDRFLAGIIRPRNGTLESVKFADLDGDGRAEIIVAVRSAGSGGYLSADAFRFEGASLQLLATVSGLGQRADPVDALRKNVERPN